jgi:hypothetical protein
MSDLVRSLQALLEEQSHLVATLKEGYQQLGQTMNEENWPGHYDALMKQRQTLQSLQEQVYRQRSLKAQFAQLYRLPAKWSLLDMVKRLNLPDRDHYVKKMISLRSELTTLRATGHLTLDRLYSLAQFKTRWHQTLSSQNRPGPTYGRTGAMGRSVGANLMGEREA